MIRAMLAYKILGTDKVVTDKSFFGEDEGYAPVILYMDSDEIKKWAKQLEMFEEE